MKSLNWLISCVVTELSDHAAAIVEMEVRDHLDAYRFLNDEGYLNNEVNRSRWTRVEEYLSRIEAAAIGCDSRA